MYLQFFIVVYHSGTSTLCLQQCHFRGKRLARDQNVTGQCERERSNESGTLWFRIQISFTHDW